MFQPGDRVRWETTADDGLPMVRYGFVGGTSLGEDHVVVMLDGDLAGDTLIRRVELAPVTITNIELHLHGSDLLDDPSLRQGLVSLWSAEADQAGLEVGPISLLGTGVRDTQGDGFALAELHAGGRHYVLRAVCEANGSEMVRVRADLPRRWEH
ncbi:MAG: hypothetical protein ABIO83_10815 [Ilumatobacteraceae bacterium]